MLVRPKKIHQKKGGPFQAKFLAARKESYQFEEFGVKITKSIETIYESIPVTPLEARIPEIIPITEKTITEYHQFQSLVNHCINNSEAVNNELRAFLLSLQSNKETRDEIMATDFMGLRGKFSDFLHGFTEIKRENEFDTKAKRKAITTSFFNYITDRNIYTHGILKLRRPDEVFVIEFIEDKKRPIYAELSIEVLQSNLDYSTYIKNIIRYISDYHKNINLGGLQADPDQILKEQGKLKFSKTKDKS